MVTTKLCPHILGWTNWPDLQRFIELTKPAIIKVVGPMAHDTVKIKDLKARSPDSKWLYRHFVNEQPLDNPKENAEAFARLIEPYLDCYDIFEDYNEIDPRDHSFDPPKPLKIDTVKRYNEFSAEFSRLMAPRGKQTVTGCWSNGQPPDEAWQYMRDCVEWANYVSLHGYGWPNMNGSPHFTLRYRHIYHDLLSFDRPLILSEVGMTNAVIGGPDLGWQSWDMPPTLYGKEGVAAAQWAWFLDRINEDPFVVSAHPYTTGRLPGDQWGTHDFTPREYELVRDYILGHPAPEYPEEEKMKNPIKVGIRKDYKIWDSAIVEVKEMEMEEYLRRCVPYEVYPSWKPEALKAQAVAARTFATWMKTHGKHPGFDVCNSACCQVMGPNTFTSTDQAVGATGGIIITYQGNPINAQYSANCGGKTEDGGAIYLSPQFCTCYEISPHGKTRYGHGKGLCQWGAEAMARKEGDPRYCADYKAILWHYYGGAVNIGGKQPPSSGPDTVAILMEIDAALASLERAKGLLQK